MIVLRDSIEIATSIDELYTWFLNLEENFVDWSPYHTEFKKLNGGLRVGDKIKFVEVVNDIEYKVKGVIKEDKKTEDSFTIIFETASGLARIYFIGEAIDSGCRFTHIEEFGMKDSFLGKIVNWLIFDLLIKKKADWDLILEDMKEDNLYLKNYLETGEYGY